MKSLYLIPEEMSRQSLISQHVSNSAYSVSRRNKGRELFTLHPFGTIFSNTFGHKNYLENLLNAPSFTNYVILGNDIAQDTQQVPYWFLFDTPPGLRNAIRAKQIIRTSTCSPSFSSVNGLCS